MKKKLLIILVGILVTSTLAGCWPFDRTYYVNPRFPVIPEPKRPQLVEPDLSKLLAEEKDRVNENTNRLMLYAKQLEYGIQMYNDHAMSMNRKNGYDGEVVSEIK